MSVPRLHERNTGRTPCQENRSENATQNEETLHEKDELEFWVTAAVDNFLKKEKERKKERKKKKKKKKKKESEQDRSHSPKCHQLCTSRRGFDGAMRATGLCVCVCVLVCVLV